MEKQEILKLMKSRVVSDYLLEQASRDANFQKGMTFGTGGVRAKVGIGSNKMNDVTVAKIYLDIVNYIKSVKKEESGVLIFFDTRHGSKHFAHLGAKIFKAKNINCELSTRALPTPTLSYSVLRHKFFLGIVVTASHNPFTDIGIKVYNEFGNQITDNDLDKMQVHMDTESPEIVTVLNELTNEENFSTDVYEDEYNEFIANNFKSLEKRLELDKIDLVYSPIHGVGKNVIPKLLSSFDFINVNLVEQQMVGDGFFKTVDSPNPESLESFTYAFSKANKTKSEVVLLTDPDADRLGSAESDGNDWRIFNGNELGALFVAFLIEINWNNLNGFILSSVVSSDLTDKMAKANNLNFKKTLTGFKYIGQLLSEGLELFFAYEESGGFLLFDSVRDKDGVQAVLLFSMMKAYYKNKKITLTDKLELIYAEHGKFITNLYVYEKIDFNTISEKLFDNIKAFQISKIEDYERQKIFTQVDIKPFTKFPKTNLLKVYLKDNEWLAFRPSGTEAKFKIYTQAWGYDEKTLLKSQERVKQLLKSLSIQGRYD